MLDKLLKNTKFQSLIKEYHKKNKDNILDILLFGSVIRGKERPNDIDLLVVSNKFMPADAIYELRTSLKALRTDINFNITEKTYNELFMESFLAREAFLTEAYSLINKEFISKGLGFTNNYLFKYELKGMNKSKRMGFYYSLYGRNNNKGMIDKLNAIKFSESILLVPVENVEEAKEYFSHQNIKANSFPVLFPSRILNLIK